MIETLKWCLTRAMCGGVRRKIRKIDISLLLDGFRRKRIRFLQQIHESYWRSHFFFDNERRNLGIGKNKRRLIIELFVPLFLGHDNWRLKLKPFSVSISPSASNMKRAGVAFVCFRFLRLKVKRYGIHLRISSYCSCHHVRPKHLNEFPLRHKDNPIKIENFSFSPSSEHQTPHWWRIEVLKRISFDHEDERCSSNMHESISDKRRTFVSLYMPRAGQEHHAVVVKSSIENFERSVQAMARNKFAFSPTFSKNFPRFLETSTEAELRLIWSRAEAKLSLDNSFKSCLI